MLLPKAVRRPLAALPALAALALGAGTGCGGARDAQTERGLLELRDELARARADRDRLEQRLVSLEVAVSEVRGKAPGAPPARSAEPAPAPRAAEARAPDGRASEPRAAEADPGPPADGLDPRAQKAYDAALALVQSKSHDAALDALAGFLVRWPDHPLVDSATYWRGVCFLAKGDLPRAAAQFEGVVARPRTGAKVPDALYELHGLKKRLGDAAGARAARAKLLADHPRSEAARRLATDRDRGGA